MKIAVISDIHGNFTALDAVLADLDRHPADQLVCLGDAIQGGPQPAKVVARLREVDCPVVMGNADYWLLTGEESGNEQISTDRMQKLQAAREWSLAQLSESDRAFIAAFQSVVEISLEEERRLLCFHGSPHSFDDFILPNTSEEEFRKMLSAFVPCIMAGGHTHLQQVRRLGETFFFNPGSVGVTYDHEQSEEDFRLDPWAEYAVLVVENGRISLEFRRVPFEVEALIEAYHRSGRPFADEAVAQYLPRGS